MNPESVNSTSSEQQDSEEASQQVTEARQQQASKNHESDIINPAEDLVYKGGYTVDPVTLLGNPAVAPQTPSDARDLRGDVFQDVEESTPK
ncbi:hypothetical protein [Leptolyngbya ohadii]|uniref:hypothetical protein n=1 Tax=Leptolyngbya ohadii TaxID=1962290 RepID=UPI000B598DE5|nr:hypothetical protein [Leptolyngbya ohadii]